MKKGFSLLEIIFIITIIAIISVFAIPKLFDNIDRANIVKLKADVALIRNEINKIKNKQILSNSTVVLDNIDNIIPTKQWEKISTNKYKASINSDTYVEFDYDKNNFTFDCDVSTDIYCKDLTQ
jgi:type II secretory pathway pseudopilin PulG